MKKINRIPVTIIQSYVEETLKLNIFKVSFI
jgi:hypothetical protein